MVTCKRYYKCTNRWFYSVPKGSTSVSVSESAFNKRAKGLTAGAGTTVDVNWEKMAKTVNEANWNKGWQSSESCATTTPIQCERLGFAW